MADKVLVHRAMALGDVILTTPIVRELFKGGDVDIDVSTNYAVVYKNNPYIVDLRNWGECNPADYDIVYNLDDAYEANPANHFVRSMFYRVFGSNLGGKTCEPGERRANHGSLLSSSRLSFSVEG